MHAWNLPVATAVLCAALATAPVRAADPPAASPAPPALGRQAVGTPEVLPTPEQILAVPVELRALLQARVIAPRIAREQRLRRLVALIFDADGMHLAYDPHATHTLTETWQTGRANCLSFTLLFVTLARAAGIDARVQEVAQAVSWYQDEGVIYNVGHVNAGVTLDGRTAVVDLDRNVLYDRWGPQPIPMARALAHFYNNRGAQFMTDGDSSSARAYFQAALALAPDFAPGWNNLGVLDSRLGAFDRARVDYQTALRHQPRHAATLSNASALYRRLGDSRQAALLARRLAQVQRRDPFAQYLFGAQAEQRGEYAQAIGFYTRAVRLYDTAHPFHFGLARVYFRVGDNRRASLELQRAHDLAGDSDPLKARYQAKLDSLQRWRQRSAPVN